MSLASRAVSALGRGRSSASSTAGRLLSSSGAAAGSACRHVSSQTSNPNKVLGRDANGGASATSNNVALVGRGDSAFGAATGTAGPTRTHFHSRMMSTSSGLVGAARGAKLTSSSTAFQRSSSGASHLLHPSNNGQHQRVNPFSTAAAAAATVPEAAAAAANTTSSPSPLLNETHRPAYLDYQATTPVDPRVLDAMLPYLTGRYGNPHSRSHAYGWDSEAATERAREQIAKLIGARPGKKEIIFTSGATESNNLAIKGAAGYLASAKKKRHIITTEIEHKCVLASCIELSKLPVDPWEVTYLPVGKDGLVDLAQLHAAIRPDTGIVSVMHINNEIGVMQNIAEIGKICRANDVLFHTDAAQAIGKVPIDVDKMNIDLLSISGHKIYGPKGIGALYVRKGAPRRVRLRPQIDGGGQEFGTRSGTLPPHLCVGLGAACDLAEREMENDKRHVEQLANYMHKRLTDQLDAVELNGSLSERYPGNLNLSFACVEGESLLMSLSKAISVSSGSACTSASLEPSYVLRALGVSEDLAHTSLRFGIGRFTTVEEIDNAVDAIVSAVTKLRDMSPLWELHQEGNAVNVQWG
ncbi:unnamed protein product [Amoebophrya sp. A120]|nr:unnamed protein product [Amoebophrya sp. A120]|eukprot:GSA120T00014929001.1